VLLKLVPYYDSRYLIIVLGIRQALGVRAPYVVFSPNSGAMMPLAVQGQPERGASARRKCLLLSSMEVITFPNWGIGYGWLHYTLAKVLFRVYLAAGLLIGSGEVKGRHRWVVQTRLKKTGAWWKRENEQKIIGSENQSCESRMAIILATAASSDFAIHGLTFDRTPMARCVFSTPQVPISNSPRPSLG
jgi:hypothetical protein